MRKILIVEDDLNIQTLEKDYLEANSFTVKTAANGNIGLVRWVLKPILLT